ncbi:MAG: major facilitator superfamily 1, partial [Frankiales bacterium]|nr:major facilitator superfamily 1 [Frankiales bacterium]
MFLSGLAVFAMLYVPQVLLPELTRAFHVSAAAATLAVSVATGGLAVGLLVLGPVSDRRGRTAILHLGLAVAGVLALLLAAVSARAIGLFVSGTALGGLTGRLAGGLLADLGGWRTAAAGIAALSLSCTLAVRALLPPSRCFRNGHRGSRRSAGSQVSTSAGPSGPATVKATRPCQAPARRRHST